MDPSTRSRFQRLRVVREPLPLQSWEEVLSRSRGAIGDTPADLDDLLTQKELASIERRFTNGFTVRSRLDRYDVIAAVAAGFLLTQTGTELFPRVDAAQLQIYVRMPSGTRIEQTERVLAAVEGAVIDELGEPDPEFPTVENDPELLPNDEDATGLPSCRQNRESSIG